MNCSCPGQKPTHRSLRALNLSLSHTLLSLFLWAYKQCIFIAHMCVCVCVCAKSVYAWNCHVYWARFARALRFRAMNSCIFESWVQNNVKMQISIGHAPQRTAAQPYAEDSWWHISRANGLTDSKTFSRFFFLGLIVKHLSRNINIVMYSNDIPIINPFYLE